MWYLSKLLSKLSHQQLDLVDIRYTLKKIYEYSEKIEGLKK
jgi:hypothetical protein